MRRDNLFWGTVLIIAGILFYLQTRGLIANFWPYFWPFLLILAGGWIILNVYWRPAETEVETFRVPLNAARSARFRFAHGVGQMEISGGAPAGQALAGSLATGMNRESWMDGDRLEVKVEAGPSFVPFLGPSQGVWRFQLTQEIPVTLVVESGASAVTLDLRDVQATRVELKTGASSTNVTMPARGVSLLDVESGAASINVRIPEGTAARIRVKEGIGSVNVNTSRFPRLDSGFYQSANFDSVPDRAEVNVESGVSSISVQ